MKRGFLLPVAGMRGAKREIHRGAAVLSGHSGIAERFSADASQVLHRI